MPDPPNHRSVHFWRRLEREVRPYWGAIGFAGLTSLLAAPLSLLLPLPLQMAVDSVLEGRPLPGFYTGIWNQ